MTDIVVASFWVHRPKDFPKACDYAAMLRVLDKSCERAGYKHVVLTDWETAPHVDAMGLRSYGGSLARNLMKAVTEVQALWLESPYSEGVDTLFVGADCIIRQDIREALPPSDFSVAFMKGHKKWRLNTGFMYCRAGARDRLAPIFRQVAQDCSTVMCDDMAALERAFSPLPKDYGEFERRGLSVSLLPMRQWNATLDSADDPASDCYVLHFLGEQRKPLFFQWAKANGFD